MQQICRTCFQQTSEKNYIELEDDRQSMDIKSKIEFCIPEMDLGLTAKPIVCILCISLLNSAVTFKRQCLDTEHYIKKFMFGLGGIKGTIDLSDIYMDAGKNKSPEHPEEETVADDLNNLLDVALNVHSVPAINSIDIEEHNIPKIEVEEDDDDNDVIFLDEELLVPKSSVVELDVLHHESYIKPPQDQITDDSPNKIIKKDNFTKKSKRKILSDHFMEGMLCAYCDVVSEDLELLLLHIHTIHKDELKTEVKPYFCPVCDYRTKYKVALVNHMKLHNVHLQKVNPAKKGKIVKCELCSFTTASPNFAKVLSAHHRKHTRKTSLP